MAEIHQHLDTFLSASPVVFYTVQAQPPFRHTYISRNVERLLGHSAERLLAEADAWFSRIHPDDQPGVYSALPQLYGSERVECEYRFRTAAGAYRWIRDERCLIRDEQGRAIDVVGCWIDISTRKEAEELQRASEELFRSIFAQSPLAIELYDADGFLVDLNPACERLFGVADRPLRGRLNLFSDAHLPRDARERVLAGETVAYEAHVDLEYAGATALRHLACVLSPWRMPGASASGFLRQVQDVTTQRCTAAENQRLALVVQQTASLVVITDPQRRITWVNAAFERLTGYTLAEVAGRHPGELLQGPETNANTVAAIREGLVANRPVRAELVNYSKTGERYWVDMNIQPIFDGEGRVSQYIAVETDISAKKLLEQDLIRAREAAVAANRAKSAFLASMSHEIRTPLNAILGFSQLLQRGSLSQQQLDHLGIITRSGEHLLSVLNGIIELSRIEAGRLTLNPERCSLPDLVDDVTRLLRLKAAEKRLDFSVEGARTLPRAVLADAAKLRQLLINLLGNAIKFTTRGRVSLRLSAAMNGPGLSRLDIEVLDTGPGIAPEEMTLLFRHFSQTKLGRSSGSGSGLGLAISREFARLMGGDITAESRPGEGSVFRAHVMLEVCADSAPTVEPGHCRILHLEPGQPGCRVMVVDGHADGLLLLERMLGPLGFDVRTAADGDLAAAIAAGWQPAVVLLDFRLVQTAPNLVPSLRGSNPAAPTKILALGSSGLAEDRDAALASGADRFLAKPILEHELLEAVGELAGVRYVRSDAAATEANSETRTESDIPNLSLLPPELLERLRAATLRADLGLITEILDEADRTDPVAAPRLRALADRFDYESILSLLANPQRT